MPALRLHGPAPGSIHLPRRPCQTDRSEQNPGAFRARFAVEVLSKSETAVEVNRKALDYLAAGSKEVWLLDNINGEVFVQTDGHMRLLRGKDLLESPLLPGFSHAVDELLLTAYAKL